MQRFKYYLDPELNLESLSRHIGTNRTYLSLAISYRYGCNFSAYVNRLRINELLNHWGLQNEDSFYGTAWGCGFNSKRTFDRAFLKEKGIAPTDFVAREKRVTLQRIKNE